MGETYVIFTALNEVEKKKEYLPEMPADGFHRLKASIILLARIHSEVDLNISLVFRKCDYIH